MWNQLVQEHRVNSVKVYLNENDIVPGVSIAYADYKRNESAAMDAVRADPSIHSIASAGAAISAGMATELPLFNIDSLKRTINETSPRLEV